MSKSRGHKNAHSRAGHKSKNKKTYKGRFQPILNAKEIEQYVDKPRRRIPIFTEWKENVKEVFN